MVSEPAILRFVSMNRIGREDWEYIKVLASSKSCSGDRFRFLEDRTNLTESSDALGCRRLEREVK